MSTSNIVKIGIIAATVAIVIMFGFIKSGGNDPVAPINPAVSEKVDTVVDKKVAEPNKEVSGSSDGVGSATPVPEAGAGVVEKEVISVGSYEVYGPEKIARASSGDVVLFFRASWCPSCRAVDADIRANLGKIPRDLTILDVNYDDSTELKKKYGVTYQHTFVQVDANSNLIKKWSGSATLQAIVGQAQ